jgi:TonB family protein
VLLAEDVGPAVAGLWPPRVVIPGWALKLTEQQQRLMLAHEKEHLRARDPCLLAAGTAALVLAPWNPALWWLVRRLRLAVEMDCDARVLSRGHSTADYAELLLQVGQHRARLPLTVAALGEPQSFLERRIRRMAVQLPRWRWLGAVAASSVGVIAIIAACEAPRPVRPEGAVRPDSLSTLAAIREGIARHFPELLSEGTGPRVEVWFVADSRNQVIRALKRPGPDTITVGIDEIRAVFRELDESNVAGWSVHRALGLGGLVRDNVRVIWIKLREGASLVGTTPESMVDDRPVLWSGPPLQYPASLRHVRIQGRVIVGAIIDSSGRAEPPSVQVIESPHPGFDQAAMNVVLQMRFRHGLFRGRAVRILIEFPVDFRARGLS